MELIENDVTSEAKKHSLVAGEARIRKIRVCCGFSKTDKNPRRFRKKFRFSIYRTIRQKKLKLSAGVIQFMLCMVNCRDIWNVCDTN
jgi:hypothetical protein